MANLFNGRFVKYNDRLIVYNFNRLHRLSEAEILIFQSVTFIQTIKSINSALNDDFTFHVTSLELSTLNSIVNANSRHNQGCSTRGLLI